MARQARPWFRSEDGWWYVYHHGKQTRLAEGKDNKGIAQKAFHRLKADDELPDKGSKLTAAEAFDVFLEHSQHDHDERTYKWYREILNSAAKSFGGLTVAKLKVYSVTRWLTTRHGGDTTMNKHIGAVKAALNYCVAQGLIPSNPISHMKKPPVACRDRIMSAEERALIFRVIPDKRFRDFLTALQESGARPSEMGRLKEEHCHLDAGVIIQVRHKTAKKTKRPRIIYLTPVLKALLEERIADTKPGDFLFRTRRGNPWTCCSLYARFRFLKKKYPELKGISSYTFRHSFATDALEKGIPDATVAELMGHVGTAMLHKYYSKLYKKTEHLRDMAAKARA